jgi:aspartate dehydrogenase
MPKKTVGLMGCGTIGTHLALAIDSGTVANASLNSLFDVAESSALNLKTRLKSDPPVYHNFDEFISSKADIIIEAASQEAVKHFGRRIIESGKDLMVMSVGALADTPFLQELLKLASIKNGYSRIYVPSGAIAGLDAIRSVRHIADSITLTTRKSPKALAGAPFFTTRNLSPDDIIKVTQVYEGPAAEAVKLFPANVNVAAVLALAGIGVEKTTVRIVADPQTTTNQHEIVAIGKFGEIKISVNNVTAPGNPKTSFLAVLSAIECLRSICEDGIRIGS